MRILKPEMVEFIHTSDWHLGNPFSSFSDGEQQALGAARFDAVARLLDYAREGGIPLVLCAGDQIDNGQLRDTRVLLRLFGIIASYPEITVVMIAGNHDPLTPGSVYLRVDRASYPANLRFVERPEAIELPELGVRIFAASLTERIGRVNPIVELLAGRRGNVSGAGRQAEPPARSGGAGQRTPSQAAGDEPRLVTIGLAHGSLAVSEAVDGGEAFPIPPQLAEEYRLDYLALGDWHSYLAAGERTCYPGTHEPLAFADDAGSLHVTIEGAGARPTIRRIREPIFRWRELRRTLRDDNLELLLSELAPASEGAEAASAAMHDIVRLSLEGYLSLQRFKQLDERLAIEGTRLFRLFVDKLPEVRPGEEELREIASEGYMPKVVARLEELAAAGDETADVALLRVYDFFRRTGQ